MSGSEGSGEERAALVPDVAELEVELFERAGGLLKSLAKKANGT